MPELHRRASAWYEQNGLVLEAVHHALSGRDLDQVEQLVADRVLTKIYHGQLVTLRGWLDTLLYKVVRSQPWLCVATAWVLIYGGQSDAAEPLLQDAERTLQDVGEPGKRRHITGHIAAIRAYVMGVGGFGVDQELIRLQTEGFRYEPDLVLAYVGHYGNRRHMYTKRFGKKKPRFVLIDGQTNQLIPIQHLNDHQS